MIAPTVDLRLKLGFDSVKHTNFTAVIVLNLRGRVVVVVVRLAVGWACARH